MQTHKDNGTDFHFLLWNTTKPAYFVRKLLKLNMQTHKIKILANFEIECNFYTNWATKYVISSVRRSSLGVVRWTCDPVQGAEVRFLLILLQSPWERDLLYIT